MSIPKRALAGGSGDHCKVLAPACGFSAPVAQKWGSAPIFQPSPGPQRCHLPLGEDAPSILGLNPSSAWLQLRDVYEPLLPSQLLL